MQRTMNEIADELAAELRIAAAEEERAALAGTVNHSGGAVGSDRAWSEAAGRYGAETKHWYRGRKTPFGNSPMSDSDFAESLAKAQSAAARMGRRWSPKEWVQNLVRRNWCQVKYSDAVFAVGRIRWGDGRDATQVSGGTGYAVQMALDAGKQVYVFNLDEGRWRDASAGWTETEPPLLTKRFAGVGTRGDAVPGRRGEYAYPAAALKAVMDVCGRSAEAASPRLASLNRLLAACAGLAPGFCSDPEETEEGAEALLKFAESACEELRSVPQRRARAHALAEELRHAAERGVMSFRQDGQKGSPAPAV